MLSYEKFHFLPPFFLIIGAVFAFLLTSSTCDKLSYWQSAPPLSLNIWQSPSVFGMRFAVCLSNCCLTSVQKGGRGHNGN